MMKKFTVLILTLTMLNAPTNSIAGGVQWCHGWSDTGKPMRPILPHKCRATQKECLATIPRSNKSMICVLVSS